MIRAGARPGQWAFGQPTGGGTHHGDPFAGYTGDNVYGYNLDGDYASNMDRDREYLTTAAIDCTGVLDVELRYYRWLGTEEYDAATIDASSNGVGLDSDLEQQRGRSTRKPGRGGVHDISAVADDVATVYVRWGTGPTELARCRIRAGTSMISRSGVLRRGRRVRATPDCDGNITFLDIGYFVAALSGEQAWINLHVARLGLAPQCPWANCNADGLGGVTFEDIVPFANLIGTSCP